MHILSLIVVLVVGAGVMWWNVEGGFREAFRELGVAGEVSV